jgi:hypothetical protein
MLAVPVLPQKEVRMHVFPSVYSLIVRVDLSIMALRQVIKTALTHWENPLNVAILPLPLLHRHSQVFKLLIVKRLMEVGMNALATPLPTSAKHPIWHKQLPVLHVRQEDLRHAAKQ